MIHAEKTGISNLEGKLLESEGVNVQGKVCCLFLRQKTSICPSHSQSQYNLIDLKQKHHE